MNTVAAVDDILRDWSIVAPYRVQPAQAGASGTSLVVSSGSGRYILRLSRNNTPGALAYEHGVLAWLAGQHLPFSVPAPVPARNGSTWVALPAGEGYGSLTPVLAGTAPAGERNLAQAQAAGRALGALIEALGRMPHPGGQPNYPPYGQFDRWFRAGGDYRTALAGLGSLADRLTRLFEVVEEQVLGLYAHLPRQPLHRDYHAANLLFQADRVSAVLDFEFAGEDVRALDLATGLTWWAMGTSSLDDRALLEAFMGGYLEAGGPLTREEAEVLPLVAVLRMATGVVWSLDRWVRGRDPSNGLVIFLARRALALSDWMSMHGDGFASQVVHWVRL